MPAAVRPEESALESAKTAAGAVLKRNRGLEVRIAQRLEGAGSAWRPAEWLLFHSALFVGISILGLLIGGGNLIIGVIFMVDRRARPVDVPRLQAQAAQEEVRGRRCPRPCS